MKVLTPIRFLYERAPGLLTIIPLLIIWEVVGRLGWFVVLPPLSAVAASAWDLIVSGRLAENAGGTIRALLLGLGISVVAGVLLGVAMGRSRIMEQVFGIYVDVLMTAPVSAIVPILVLLFGTGSQSIVAAVILFTFFVIVVNTYTGVKEVSHDLIEMAESFQCSRWMLLRKVIVPGALPMIFTGLRLGMGRSFNGAVFGEMLISVVGLGGLLLLFGSRFNFERLDALILIIVGAAVLMMTAVEWVERRILSGRYGLTRHL